LIVFDQQVIDTNRLSPELPMNGSNGVNGHHQQQSKFNNNTPIINNNGNHRNSASPPPMQQQLTGPYATRSWYYGRLTREQSDLLLNSRGIDGDYLVRDSESNVCLSNYRLLPINYVKSM
jgi:hypothetical protein